MKKFLGIFGLCMALLPAFAFADQAAYIEKGEAEAAMNVLMGNSVIRHYCQPCGDKNWTQENIGSVEAGHTGYEQYWQVLVNGKGIDLAYVYVETDGGWRNVAMMLEIQVSDVPLILPGTKAVTEQ